MYVPVKRNAGDRCSVISVVEDETERKRMDDELKAAKETAESASRSKSVFLANMSHEIRTPLNAVLGFAQLMQRQKDLTPTMKEYVDSIRRSGTHLLELITDILEMSKIEAGREKLSPIAFDLHALLDDVERMMRVRTDQKNVRINTSCGDTPVRIIADQGKVRQVLINLLGNAVKFTDAGSIGVRASAVGTSSIAIDVFDTGCGIAPSEQHAVFRSFEQTSSGLRAGGTGLGMAISRGFARLMGGDLVLVKSVEDRGSQFRFTFLYEPCRGECMSKDSAQRTVVGLGADTLLRTVMVVDDDVNNRIVLEGLLTDVGFSVVCAESGIQALALAEQSLPDAVLMDFRMPGMNGIEAAKRIRLLPGAAGIPVVLVTASVLAEDRDTALAEGIDAFVQKPFREGDIFTALAGVGRVSYLYAEETKQDAVPQTDFDPSDIPSVLRDEIRAAVEDGDMQAFQSVLERIVPVNAGAAESLRFMASRFEYQRILDALRR